MAPRPIVGAFCPLGLNDRTTIPQLMTQSNPDNVPAHKVIHVDAADKTLTYGGLRQQAACGAWGLQRRLGVREGDRMLVLVPNSTDFIVLCHATLWMGAVFAPLNHAALASDIAHAVAIVRPSVIAVEPSKLDALDAALRQCPCVPRPTVFTVLRRARHLPLFPDDVAGRSDGESLAPYDLGDRSTKDVAALIVFSSGTTGQTKGVLQSHYNIVSNLIQMRTSVPQMMHHDLVEVFFPPFCHVYGLNVAVFGGVWVGSLTCSLAAFDLDTFCRKSAAYRANWAHILPPIAVQLVNSDVPTRYDLSTWKILLIAGAPTKKELQTRLKDRFGGGLKIIQGKYGGGRGHQRRLAHVCAARLTRAGFGMSECSPTVTLQSLTDAHIMGTVGKPIAGTEVRLVNPDTGEDVAPGQDGELWVKGPQTMMGYVDNDEATRAAYVGEWLRTGDILREDADGNLWVTDRLKELIKYKGFQVPPSELEGVLLGHPSVQDAAVTSVYSDAEATELPVAYVTLRPPVVSLSPPQKQTQLDEIRRWADARLTGYKRLRGGVFELDPLPKTPSGKILRRELPCRRAQAARTSKL